MDDHCSDGNEHLLRVRSALCAVLIMVLCSPSLNVCFSGVPKRFQIFFSFWFILFFGLFAHIHTQFSSFHVSHPSASSIYLSQVRDCVGYDNSRVSLDDVGTRRKANPVVLQEADARRRREKEEPKEKEKAQSNEETTTTTVPFGFAYGVSITMPSFSWNKQDLGQENKEDDENGMKEEAEERTKEENGKEEGNEKEERVREKRKAEENEGGARKKDAVEQQVIENGERQRRENAERFTEKRGDNGIPSL